MKQKNLRHSGITMYEYVRRTHKGYGMIYPNKLNLDGIGETNVYIGEHEKWPPRFHIIDPISHKYITTISLLKPEYIGTKSLRLNDRQKEQLVEWLESQYNPFNNPIREMVLDLFDNWILSYTKGGDMEYTYEIPDYTLLK